MVRAPTLTLNSGSYLPQTASFVMFLSVPCTQGRHWHRITIESVSHRNLFSLFLSIYFNSALMTAPSHLRREPRSHSFSRSWHVPPSVLIEDKVTVLGNECRRLKGSHVWAISRCKKVEIETNDLWVLRPPRACAEEGCLQHVTTFHSVTLLRDPGTS